jgi:hypothetical protein
VSQRRVRTRFDRRIPAYPRNLLPFAVVGAAAIGIRLLQEDVGWIQVFGWSVAGFAFIVGLMAVLVLLPLTGEGTRVRLTDRELFVGRRRLGLEDIVEVRVASQTELNRAQLFRWRIGDIQIAYTGKKIAFGTTEAVLIHDARQKRRPWLLVDVGNAGDFVSLVRAAKEAADGSV